MRLVQTVPTMRRHKATRCRHCDFCRPRGAGCGVCMCVERGSSGAVVLGDQMACGSYRPALEQAVHTAA